MNKTTSKRLLALDILRGITIAGKKIQKISAGGKKLCICTKYN